MLQTEKVILKQPHVYFPIFIQVHNPIKQDNLSKNLTVLLKDPNKWCE